MLAKECLVYPGVISIERAYKYLLIDIFGDQMVFYPRLFYSYGCA